MLPQPGEQANLEAIRGELSDLVFSEMAQANSYEELFKRLSDYINQLITADFHRLITLLYTLDISEHKLKTLLNNYGNQNAGDLISKMIIERQLQKIMSRKSFKTEENIPDEDKW